MDSYDSINKQIEILNETKNSPKPDDENHEFSWQKQLALFLSGFAYAGLLAISFIVALIEELFLKNNPARSIIGNFVCYAILLAILIAISLTQRSVFFKKIRNYKNYFGGILCGVGAIIVEIIVSIIILQFFQGEQNANQQSVIDMTLSYPTISVITFCFIGPLAEELTYRVGLYGLLKRKNKIIAIIVESIIFASIHFDFFSADLISELAHFPIYLCIGICLTLTYEKFDLPGSYIAHICLNLLSIIGIFLS